jgi:hypothetical protein
MYSHVFSWITSNKPSARVFYAFLCILMYSHVFLCILMYYQRYVFSSGFLCILMYSYVFSCINSLQFDPSSTRIHRNTYFLLIVRVFYAFSCILMYSHVLPAVCLQFDPRFYTSIPEYIISYDSSFFYVFSCILMYLQVMQKGGSFFASWRRNEIEFKPKENRFGNYQKPKNQEYIVYFSQNRV